MKILTGAKRLLHRGIARDLGSDAQFDLRIVGFDEDAPGSGTNAAAIVRLPRDVLDVGCPTAHAATGRADQVVVGVDPSRDRVDALEVAVAVGGDFLLNKFSLENQVNRRMLTSKLLERLFVSVRKVDPDLLEGS